ncbi:MAG: hypothetical protein QW589_03940 [Candidatus Bathyarchaeia archaeon]
MNTIKKIKKCKKVSEAIELVTDEIMKIYPIVNTTDACIENAKELVKNGVDGIVIIIPSGKENQVYSILKDEVIPSLKML